MEFKVGDRVKYFMLDVIGTVIRVDTRDIYNTATGRYVPPKALDDYIYVKWDDRNREEIVNINILIKIEDKKTHMPEWF